VVKRSALGGFASLGIFALGAASYKRVDACEMQNRIANRIYWNFTAGGEPGAPTIAAPVPAAAFERHGVSSCCDGSLPDSNVADNRPSAILTPITPYSSSHWPRNLCGALQTTGRVRSSLFGRVAQSYFPC